MSSSKSLRHRVKQLLITFPCGCLTLIISISIFYYLQKINHLSSLDLCLDSHSVIYNGEVSRILLYIWFHGNEPTLILSIILLVTFGSLSEKQAGTLRLFYIVFILSIVTAIFSMLTAKFFDFINFYSSGTKTYYAGLGLYAPLFGLMVILFKNSQMKKIILVFFIVQTHWVPWIFVVVCLLIVPRFNFLFAICGCLSGILYSKWLGNWIGLPISFISKIDCMLSSLLQCLPCVNYVRGTTNKLPFYQRDIIQSKPHLHLGQYQDFPVVSQSTVSQSKLQELHKMGFPFEKSVVALEQANGNVKNAVSILTKNSQNIVLPNAVSNGSAIKHS